MSFRRLGNKKRCCFPRKMIGPFFQLPSPTTVGPDEEAVRTARVNENRGLKSLLEIQNTWVF